MRIAAEHDIDLEQVEGTGRGGRVRKQDVLAYMESGGNGAAHGAADAHRVALPARRAGRPAQAEVAARPPEEAAAAGAGRRAGCRPSRCRPARSGPLSRMRQSIGRHMKASLDTAATCTTIVEVDMTRVEALRRKQQSLTGLAYIARATIEALREFPQLNATLEGETFTTYDGVHLGIAVSLGEGGLIVPVIRDAQDLSVEGLASRIKDLARRARANAAHARTRSAAARSRSPTRAATARSSPPR